tara:strand:+ start:318 stop:536 length:219 start_codon:yes stop_codon:yes gene_type:complete
MPNIVKLDRWLNDRTVKIPIIQVMSPRIFVACDRDKENLSTTKVIAGSISDIDDVIAAKNNKTKKDVEIKVP